VDAGAEDIPAKQLAMATSEQRIVRRDTDFESIVMAQLQVSKGSLPTGTLPVGWQP